MADYYRQYPGTSAAGFAWRLGGGVDPLAPVVKSWWTPEQRSVPVAVTPTRNSSYDLWRQQQDQLARQRAAAAVTPQTPPLSVMSLTKSPAVQTAWGSFMDRLRGSTNTINQDLNSQRSLINQTLSASNPASAQEAAAIEAYFNGDIRRQLDAIENSRTGAINSIAGRIAMETEADMKRRQLAGGAGESSYLKALRAKSLGDIYAKAAEADAAQKLANLQWFESAKSGMLGRRLGLDAARVNLSSIPIQTRLSAEQSLANQLAGLSAIDQANQFYGVFGEQPNLYGLERGFKTPS